MAEARTGRWLARLRAVADEPDPLPPSRGPAHDHGAWAVIGIVRGRDAASIHVDGTDIVTRTRHTHDVATGAASPLRPPFAEAAGR